MGEALGAYPPWGMPIGGMPLPFGMPPFPPFMPYGPGGAWAHQSGPSQAAQAPMYGRWGGGSQQGRSSTPDRGRPSQAHRKSQRPRFTRSAYQPDPNAVRPEDSKPCRTLFVRNVAFEVDMLLLRADFAAFGEIRTWFDIVQRRGMLFVTYYDTRAADNARVHMNQKVYEGRALDVHFSLPKDEDQQQHCDRTKNQGTLFVSLLEATQPLTDEALQAKFVEFGDIRSIRTYKDQAHTRFLEYWDSRACVAAHDALQDTEFLGGHLSIKFAWDLATVSLVTDARQRSEAKAAAEARAQAILAEEPAPLPEAEEPATTTIEPPPIASPAPEVWEQAQKVQQVRGFDSHQLLASWGHAQSAQQGAEITTAPPLSQMTDMPRPSDSGSALSSTDVSHATLRRVPEEGECRANERDSHPPPPLRMGDVGVPATAAPNPTNEAADVASAAAGQRPNVDPVLCVAESGCAPVDVPPPA